MNFVEQSISGVFLARLNTLRDARGTFTKTYTSSAVGPTGLDYRIREEFFTVSAAGVIRGMHFQVPPHDHAKVVCCVAGAVRDVLLDLRRGSGFGKVLAVELDSDSPAVLVIPPGVAHGFLALKHESVMVYKTTSEHCPEADRGVLWNSFGFDWGMDREPIISNRDALHPRLEEFVSPF